MNLGPENKPANSGQGLEGHKPAAKTAGLVILLGGGALVLYATLFPFDFLARGDPSLRALVASFDRSLSGSYRTRDFWGNVLLFAPFGFGFAQLVLSRQRHWLVAGSLTLAAAALLSITIEVLQHYLPARQSALADVVANSLGALAGLLTFRVVGVSLIAVLADNASRLGRRLSLGKALVGYVIYTSVLLLAVVLMRAAPSLANWDPSFPLLVGNERTGDRPWQGKVGTVWVADRALLPADVGQIFATADPQQVAGESLAAWYQLGEGGGGQDKSGQLAPLTWQGGPGPAVPVGDVQVGAGRWLATRDPASRLSERVRSTSQFSIGATFTASATYQNGPARLLSLSGDPYQRNFTLGQDGSDLVFRWRTALSGPAGAKPELVVPGLFADGRTHQVVITYDASTLRLFVDGTDRAYTFSLAPGAALFWLVTPQGIRQYYLSSHGDLVWQTLSAMLIFVPLVLLLGLVRKVPAPGWRKALGAGAATLPAVLLLGTLAGLY